MLTDEAVQSAPRRVPVAHLAVAAVAAAVVLFATRHDPLLSPDSITYLSAAERLRAADGFVDFTGEPLTHFPPVFPVLLAPGGRNLVWASIIGAAGAAAVAALLFDLLASRVRTSLAVAGALAYALSQTAVRIESTVWSETPHLVLALATIRVLGREPLTLRRSAAAGALAGLAFLTRYVGAGLVATGLVMVFAATFDAGVRSMRRCAVAYLAPPAALASLWVARNLIATGEPLGPHFEGGAGSSFETLLRQVVTALGQLVTDNGSATSLTRAVGYLVLVGVLVALAISLARRPWNVLDVGMAMLAGFSIVVPVASSVIAGTDVSNRLLAPTLIPVVYFVVVLVDRWADHRLLLGTAGVVGAVTVALGVGAAIDAPDRLDGSAGNAELFSPELYDLVGALPDDSNVLTNNPQRVWWHTDHFPVKFAFTKPKPGNSHFPLSPDDTLQQVCEGDTYLAWFSTLLNAQGASPDELRPDLAAHISLIEIDRVPGGTLFALEVVEPASCE